MSAGYSFDGGKDMLRFQFCQSPFRREGSDMYACNLMWNGSRGCFDSIWSLNMIEYLPGRFMGYLAFGNHFTFGNLTVFADFMNRSFADKMSFLSDNPAIISLSKDKRFSKYFKKYLISLPSPVHGHRMCCR